MIEELKDKELTDIKYLRARMTGNVGLALDHAYNLGFFDGEKNIAKKKGHWIDITNKNGTVIAVRCSHCKESPKHAIKSDYCPNCGARMATEENKE